MSVDLVVLVRSFSCLVSALVTDDVTERTRDSVESLLVDAARVQSMLDTVRLAAARQLERLADRSGMSDPAEVLARHGRSSGRQARQTVRRGRIIDDIPLLSGLLAEGAVSVDHLDVIAQAMSRLEPDERAVLAGDSEWIAAIAARSTPEALARALRQRVRQLSIDTGVARLERQRRATTLRFWNDPDTGMCRLAGEFDPENGVRLTARLRAIVETLFSGPLPETCPDDDRKHGHLTALALLNLLDSVPGARSGRGEAEFLVIIDQQTLWNGVHAGSRVEIDGGFELPVETLRRHACTASIIPVVLGGDGVVRDVGRAQRIATPAQRRSMRAMYSTCAIPACDTGFHDCQLHHILYWRNGGRTDEDNVVPLCRKHHRNVHEGGWQLHLRPGDRLLTITLPNGSTRTHPPPFANAA